MISNLAAARQYLTDHPLTNQALLKLLQTSVAKKKVTFAIDQWQAEISKIALMRGKNAY